MEEVDLRLDPAEASDLCPLVAPELLAERGWDRAFVTVMDDAPAEGAVAVLGHEHGAEAGTGWHAQRVELQLQSGKQSTQDAEGCARREGWIYVFGSQFGSKDGPLEAKRSWMARVREQDLATAVLRGDRAPAQLARLRFSLHRAVNDALAAAQLELLPMGEATRDAYIDATIRRGAAKDKRWSGRVRSADHPINVEGAAFREDGRLLLGLRYPVTAEGQPLLVELEEPERLFEDPEHPPHCTAVWWLDGAGGRDAPVGVRALHGEGRDRFHAVVGNLDSQGKSVAVLADHHEGGRARSMHVSFELPLSAAGGPVMATIVHEFEDLRRVEGLAIADDGHAHYVVDREGEVALRTLLLGEPATTHAN